MCCYLCILCCCPHSYISSRMANNIMEKLSNPLLHIQPKFNLDSWNGSIRYDKIIKKDLVHKIRNALKINKINTFSMNMREEYYYIEQIVFYLYKRILTYFDENDLKKFELIELEYFCNIPKTPLDLINNIENQCMYNFRNHIVELKTHSLDIATKDKSEQIILQEKWKTHNSALNRLELKTLEERREDLCLLFSLVQVSS